MLHTKLCHTHGASRSLSHVIEINSASFNVTSNLYYALQNLRRKFSPRTLWINAICINQKDDNEKSTQVELIAKIYKKATRVLI